MFSSQHPLRLTTSSYLELRPYDNLKDGPDLPTFSNLCVPRLHRQFNTFAMAYSSVEFGNMRFYGLDSNGLPHWIRQRCRLEGKY